MNNRIALAAVILAVVAPPLAAQTGEGTYSTVPTSTETVTLPGGAVHVTSRYIMISRASTPTFPLHNTKNECIGLIRIVGNTTPAASGSCFAVTIDGHGYSMWWEATESGTSACPGLCGNWVLYGGYGRFAGASGEGIFRREAEFHDGSGVGTWTGTVELRQASAP